ncbi:hypothetical protein LJB84_02230 [Bacteroidales bacterium OttesenSCG-928-J19]|nr:hypothetical protein [Bacteroidales bacterium OttesenSCG-928-J19]
MGEKTRNYLYYICSLILLITAVGFFFEKTYIPYIYAVASAGSAVALLAGSYKGENLRLKRLNVQQFIAAILLPISSGFMFKGERDWYLFLMVSAVLQAYIVFVRDYELKKETKKHGEDNESSK